MDIETAERAATKLGETILSRKGYEIVDTGRRPNAARWPGSPATATCPTCRYAST